ncbi:hypothetical protein [Mesobacillus zeae]|uniref:Uncharacterized protein n=1 Tax=Mesobacillus zeae TaxID=1917180 RepID=A0A398B7T5_9BACI|nr:hypothetical protein [Mesobacillus zeae]RID86015.1 hypothetical protein D1970_07880 [Mesobacillus zeae]
MRKFLTAISLTLFFYTALYFCLMVANSLSKIGLDGRIPFIAATIAPIIGLIIAFFGKGKLKGASIGLNVMVILFFDYYFILGLFWDA